MKAMLFWPQCVDRFKRCAADTATIAKHDTGNLSYVSQWLNSWSTASSCEISLDIFDDSVRKAKAYTKWVTEDTWQIQTK